MRKKLELHQETLKKLTQKPENRTPGAFSVDCTFVVTCATNCGSCVSPCHV